MLGAAALAFGLCADTADEAPKDLVLIHTGTLPIVLTAPHGGRLEIPDVPVRSAPDAAHAAAFKKWNGFRTGTDTNTDTLTLRIAAEIEKLTGHKPYLVLAKFKRRFVDVNRPAKRATAKLDAPDGWSAVKACTF